MEKVIVYTQPDCPYSRSLVESLISDSVYFEQKSILDPIHRQQAVLLGVTQIPTAFVGAELFSGLELNTLSRIKRCLTKGGA